MTTDLPRTGAEAAPRYAGGYLLGAKLGEGGMGVVHRSRTADGTDVAVKVLRSHIAHDQHARERLRREVTTLARVSHPRVASVLDADVDGPAPYIVTEYVPGAPLDAVVAEQGPLSAEALVRLGRGLSEALGAIHQVGIVHRDLKPGNVLMAGDEPVVIDFGIAQVSEDARLTMTGMVMGTPGYLSPEVVEGGSVTEATDWWGWAATLSFAASGQPPFGRGPMSVVLDRVIRGRTQLSGVDPQLKPLLLAALQPDPGRRPPAPEVMAALEAYAAHRPVTDELTQLVPTQPTGTLQPEPTPDAPWVVGAPSAMESTRAQPVLDPTRQQLVAPTRQRSPAATPYPEGPRPAPEPYFEGRRPAPEPLGAPREGAERGYLPRGGDPRIGRPMRTGTLAAMLLAFVAVAMLAPLLAWGLLAIWSALGRWVDRAMTGLVLRRHEAGPRGTDLPMTMLAAPWHLLAALLSTALALVLPLAFAISATVLTSYGIEVLGQTSTGVEHPVPVAVGSSLGALTAWWGSGGISVRRGSRTMIRAAVPTGPVTQALVAFLAAGGLALGAWSVLEDQDVSWWPTASSRPPFVDGIWPGVLD